MHNVVFFCSSAAAARRLPRTLLQWLLLLLLLLLLPPLLTLLLLPVLLSVPPPSQVSAVASAVADTAAASAAATVAVAAAAAAAVVTDIAATAAAVTVAAASSRFVAPASSPRSYRPCPITLASWHSSLGSCGRKPPAKWVGEGLAGRYLWLLHASLPSAESHLGGRQHRSDETYKHGFDKTSAVCARVAHKNLQYLRNTF